MTQNKAVVYLPSHLPTEAIHQIRHKIQRDTAVRIEVEKTTEKQKEYVVDFYDSESTRPLREVDAIHVANANLSAIQEIVDKIRNENGA